MTLRDDLAAAVPTVDPAVAVAVNQWLARRRSARFQIGQRAYALRWKPAPARLALGAAGFVLECASGAHRFGIALEDIGVIDARLAGAPFSQLPVAARDLVAERVLDDFLRLLPPRLSAGLELLALRWPTGGWDVPACALGYTLQRDPDGGSGDGLLFADGPATLAWLDAALPATPDPAADARFAGVPLRVYVELPGIRVSLAQLRELEAGDVVQLPGAQLSPRGMSATLRARGHADWRWRCTVRRRTVSLEPTPVERVDIALAGHVEALDAAAALSPPDDAMKMHPLSDVELPLSFTLGERLLTLDEIERLQPGQTLELPQDATDATVRIEVHGVAVAEGQLILMGRKLGVRVVRTFETRVESGSGPAAA
ncbi:FliM/FliN family flagellar motor switch protein [Aquabacterium sp. A7-Y]|uniref:FliM/FliN family flagellar motor switch protein n=1 Tax=Aquabacterium sp. A7-Y TaxID=1349605 RepID=UPI00223E6A46|nr:FliM/FliN family flagellar motor switch protein [Aquabacterium sp. A7-Y]MCW7539738.1 FliM/FliN family flagellar motor switch protein [Aquabacterium sp. A7-Y]